MRRQIDIVQLHVKQVRIGEAYLLEYALYEPFGNL